MSKKDFRTACAVCNLTIGLEIDHVNENHFDNSSGNRMTLCKHHHMEKTRMGRDLFKELLQLTRAHRDIKDTTRQTAQRWILKKENLKSNGYQLEMDINTLMTHNRNDT
jgi:hypothetical protein